MCALEEFGERRFNPLALDSRVLRPLEGRDCAAGVDSQRTKAGLSTGILTRLWLHALFAVAPLLAPLHAAAQASTASAPQAGQAAMEETRREATRHVVEALKSFWLSPAPTEVEIRAGKRALDDVRHLLPHVGDPHRYEYLRSLRGAEFFLGLPLTDVNTLVAEWASLRARGIGVDWQPPKHLDLQIRSGDTLMAGWLGRFDESRAMYRAFLSEIRRDAVAGSQAGRENLQWVLSQMGGQRLWHEEVARFAEDIADELGPNDELSARALVSASFTLRVVQVLQRATSLAERGYRLALNFPSPLREKLLVGASSQLGLAYAQSGRLLEAKPLLEYARDAAYRMNDPSVLSRAWVWYSTAHLYTQLGDYDESIKEWIRAIDVINERPLPEFDPEYFALDRSVVRLWIAHVHALAGRDDVALAEFDAAMSHPKMWSGHDPWIHVTYPVFARLLLRAGRADVAQRLLEIGKRAAFNSAGPESPDVATTELGLATLQSRAPGGESAARDSQAAALAMLMHQSASFSLAEAWFEIADDADRRASKAPQRSFDSVIYLYKTGAMELVRARAKAINTDQPVELALGSFVKPLRRLAELLDRSGRPIEAQEVRAQVIIEEQYAFVRRSPKRGALRSGTRDAEIPLTRQERGVQSWQQSATSAASEHRRVVINEQARVFSGFALTRGEAFPFPERWTQSVERTRHATKDLLTAIERLDAPGAVQARRATTAQERRALRLPASSAFSALVRINIGQEGVYASVSTVMGQRSVPLAVSPAELRVEVAAFRAALSNPAMDVYPSAQRLWRWLLSPLWQSEPRMRRGRVHFELDGALRYIPFAALHDGRSFLAQKVVVTQGDVALNAPTVDPAGARTVAVIGAKSLIALGAATHDDSTPTLSHVAAEIQSVTSAWQTTAHHAARQSNGAGREDLLRAIADRPTVLHLAAHYRFRPGNETRSSLLLHGGEQLSMAEMRQHSFAGIRLVTLSACDSALDFDDGAEISGLARTLIASGAESVLGSLWAVSDEASAAWMATFYRDWRGRESKMAKADAIARVQREFINTANVSQKTDAMRSPDWSHPYFWAPYVISGHL